MPVTGETQLYVRVTAADMSITGKGRPMREFDCVVCGGITIRQDGGPGWVYVPESELISSTFDLLDTTPGLRPGCTLK